MAVERDFKIVRTVERLNRIIHESRLTTRFVSLFYGEIEDDGSTDVRQRRAIRTRSTSTA